MSYTNSIGTNYKTRNKTLGKVEKKTYRYPHRAP